MSRSALFAVGLSISLAAAVRADHAVACGGCFAPPGAAQVVTDHRMVLSISATQTTLWDQFSYAGNPTEFSWILPIHYAPEVQVDLADDRFMTVLDNLSVPVLQRPYAPSQFCNTPPPTGFADAAAPADASSDVTVFRQEVVGPYDVAIIGSTDAMAIRDWLSQHGYNVPPAIGPVIDHYTALHMDFLALRLSAGDGVSRMTPVRVTVPGYAPTLPLRMIAAGVADKVGLTLLVMADARLEAQNYANAEVDPGALTYDFDHPTDPGTDFIHAEQDLSSAMGGRLWVTESALFQQSDFLRAIALNSQSVLPHDAGGCGPGVDGGVACQSTNPSDDMNVALTGLSARPMVTRLRASFGAAELDQDLLLAASVANVERSRSYDYGHVLHTPPPVMCDAGVHGGTDAHVPATDSSIAMQDASGGTVPPAGHLAGGGGCATQGTVGKPGTGAVGLVGVVFGLGAAARLRRRNRGRERKRGGGGE